MEDVAAEQSHLTPAKRDNLAKLLKKREELFSEKLGLHPNKKLILNCCQGLRKCMPDITLCQEYTETHSKRNVDT